MKTLLTALLLLFLFASNADAYPRHERDAPVYPTADRCGQAHAVIKCCKVWRHGKRVKVCHRVPC